MATISGVCSKCGKVLEFAPHEVEIAGNIARLCDGCNEEFGRRFLKWLVGTADTKDAARKAKRVEAD